MSYGELEQSSSRLARLLAEAGCEPGDRVCLFVPKSPATIVSILATLKASCVYVPIDVASPDAILTGRYDARPWPERAESDDIVEETTSGDVDDDCARLRRSNDSLYPS